MREGLSKMRASRFGPLLCVKGGCTLEDLIIIGGKSVKKTCSPTDKGVLPGLSGKRRKEAHVPVLEHCGHC